MTVKRLNAQGELVFKYAEELNKTNSEIVKDALKEKIASTYTKNIIELILLSEVSMDEFKEKLYRKKSLLLTQEELEKVLEEEALKEGEKFLSELNSCWRYGKELPKLTAKKDGETYVLLRKFGVGERFLNEYADGIVEQEGLDKLLEDKGFAYIYAKYRLTAKIKKYLDSKRGIIDYTISEPYVNKELKCMNIDLNIRIKEASLFEKGRLVDILCGLKQF